MIEGLELRTGYLSDAASRDALRDLLSDVFDIDISIMERLGGYDASAVAFGYFDEAGRCVGNITAFDMPLMIHGRQVRAAGYQSGAVRPEYRRRGLYQKLMRLALAHSQAEEFELDILMTDKPGLYEPYGFETIPQHHFTGSVEPAAAPSMRRLSVQDAGDVALIRALLAARQAVSDRFAVLRQAEMFLFNAAADGDIQLGHLPAEDCVVAWRSDGGTLRLLDIVGATIPPLASIVAAIGDTGRQVEVHFASDRLDWTGRTELHSGDCVLMARGHVPIQIDGLPLMLSPMADF